MVRTGRPILLAFLMLALAALTGTTRGAATRADEPEAGPVDSAGMKRYETAYYLIHTDLSADQAKEAGLRMTRMAEEYHRRTSGFSGAIRDKLPFYLYAHESDYLAAGGRPGSAGQYDPNSRRLMACAHANDAGHISPAIWHTVQHEGFHQFADAVIGGDLPVWVNEGLAEYFGEALFTGDGFVSGAIPAWRQQRIVAEIDHGKFRPIKDMMEMSHRAWNEGLSLTNYDQAWSMAQFLAHGDGGRYQGAFSNFMSQLGRGAPWQRAWGQTFGDAVGFEAKWKAWWKSLPPDATADLYDRAAVETLTSFLARAAAAGQTFDGWAEFSRHADSGKLQSSDADWLPQALLASALARAKTMTDAGATFTLQSDRARPSGLTCAMKDGTRYVGTFRAPRGGKVSLVKVVQKKG